MQADSALRFELDYCVPLGLPHSVFKSWDPYDQALALSWNLLKAQTCARCGTMSHEWLDDKGRPIEPPPYMIRSHRCHGCVVMEQERKQIPQDDQFTIQFYYERTPKWLKRNQGQRRKNK